MPETSGLEPANVAFKLDPSLHLIMKGAKEVLDLPNLDAVYSRAVSEFVVNHPEIAEALLGELQTEEAVVAGAIQWLHSLGDTEPN